MSEVAIDKTRCACCGACVETCSERIFAQTESGAIPHRLHPGLCIACGHCVAMCPHEAVRHPAFPDGTVHAVNRGNMPRVEQVMEMLRMRRSIRHFEDRPVENPVMEQVLEGARCAPSAHNFQTTEYVVVRDKAVLRTITDLVASCYAGVMRQLKNPVIRTLYGLTVSKGEIRSALHLLPDFEMVVEAAQQGEDPFLHDAPCLVVTHAARSVNFPEANAILALHNATLVAQALGLGSFLVGYLVGACKRDKRIPRLLSVPNDHEVYGALALGYPKREFKNWVERRPLRVRWL